MTVIPAKRRAGGARKEREPGPISLGLWLWFPALALAALGRPG